MLRVKNYSFVSKRLICISRIHVESFNHIVTQGFDLIVDDFLNLFFINSMSNSIMIRLIGLYMSKPYILDKKKRFKSIPRYCKEARISYKSDLIGLILIVPHSHAPPQEWGFGKSGIEKGGTRSEAERKKGSTFRSLGITSGSLFMFRSCSVPLFQSHFFQSHSRGNLMGNMNKNMNQNTDVGNMNPKVGNMNDNNQKIILKIGKFPVITRSLKCSLANLNTTQLVEIDEEKSEVGGYFIINGIEKLIRPLLVPKKNMIQVLSKISNAEKSELCTSLSCSFRSVNKIQNSKTLYLHYLISGNIYARLIIRKQEFFIPVVILIKSLIEISDKQLIGYFTNFNCKDSFLRQRAMNMIKDTYSLCEFSQKKYISVFLGKILNLIDETKNANYLKTTNFFFSKYLFIHLGSDVKSKCNLLLLMIRKLFSVCKNACKEDNPDSIDSQELLFPGFLYLIYLKERLERSFLNFFSNKKEKKNNQKIPFNLKFLNAYFDSITIGIENFISSGNICSDFKEELLQLSGLSVSIERINFGKFISYFRGVHKGKFFSEMKSTKNRKLYPQAWGFMCPIHTPDGVLCGILNHLSSSIVTTICNPIEKDCFQKYLFRNESLCSPQEVPTIVGYTTEVGNYKKHSRSGLIVNSVILLDGKVMKSVKKKRFKWMVDKLRSEKVSQFGIISSATEIFHLSRLPKDFISSCFFSSESGRLLRPTFWKRYKLEQKSIFKKNKYFSCTIEQQLETIGAHEQTLLNIQNSDIKNNKKTGKYNWTHMEVDFGNILSVIAGLTPFSDLNQSPRNMYQCQMSKQSIGVPFYTFWRRSDIKWYFLLFPQVPICRNKALQDGLGLDAFPNGTNSIIAILSYTGFDMEDAIVLNRSSIDRGFFMSEVSSSYYIQKETFGSCSPPCSHVPPQEWGFEKSGIEKGERGTQRWGTGNQKYKENPNDGDFSIVNSGKIITQGDPLFTNKNKKADGNKKIFICYNNQEKSITQKIKLLSLKKEKKTSGVCIGLRCRRRPVVGDKFASRHGQKGIVGLNYFSFDLPFSELGMIPDILFNPHGFPSRMTIGVILESLAGKIGSLEGSFCDSSSFYFTKKYLGTYQLCEKLKKFGFQFHGNEMFYSGYTGEPFKVEVYTGIVQYQRLKHMVNDKVQVSEIGPRNLITRQPIKGRKIGGSIRFGEMEKDALLGHGSVFLLHDRLQLASDLHTIKINAKTGNILGLNSICRKNKTFCVKMCANKTLFLPYAVKFLMTELSVMNIKIILNQIEI